MTNEELSRAVTEHEGWEYNKGLRGSDGLGPMFNSFWAHSDGRFTVYDSCPPYATSWELTGPLVEKYNMHVWKDGTDGVWYAAHHNADDVQVADTPLRAICLAVLEVQGD